MRPFFCQANPPATGSDDNAYVIAVIGANRQTSVI
jgi:hypothetical protein